MTACVWKFRAPLPIMMALSIMAQPALAQGTPAPAAPSPTDVHFDVPQDRGPQQVKVLIREFPVGGSSGWHTHPGVEIAYLLEGEMSLEQEGRPMRQLKAGENFMVPRGVPHNGVNIGKVRARAFITYVTDKGEPVRSAVEPPHRH